MIGSFRKIVSLALSLALAACEGGVELKTVGGIPASPAPVKIQAGTKFVLEEKDDPTRDAYPFILLLDPKMICDDLTFYNQDGDLVKGTRSCEVSSLGQYEPNLKAENIKAGISIGSVEGTLKPSPRDCEADGATNCVAVTNFPAVDKVSKLAVGNLAKISSSVTVGGVVGTLANCSADGMTACLTVSGFPSANTTGAAAKILSGQTLAGVSGSATVAPSNCSSDGQTNCVAIATYPALQKSLLTASVLKSGTVINGVTGAYPNATYPLVSNTAATDLTTFASQVTTDGNFEFFDSAGVRYTGSGDSDLLAANIRSGTAIESLSTTGTMPAILPSPPTSLTTAFFTTPDRVILNWDSTGASGYLVVARAGAAPTFNPTRTTTYTAGAQGADTILYVGSATSYTHSGVTAGIFYHYAVYSFDANRFYSATPVTAMNSTTFCSSLAGGAWVTVPGDATYGTSNFCVMKYEAKNVGGVPTSQTALTPWVDISTTTAQATCQALGTYYDLISNDQWMTLAANIASVGSNWSNGTVGSGFLNRGHSDDNPVATACAASSDETLAFVQTDCTPKNSSGDVFNQKRTHTLSTGAVLWDLAGNVWEMTSYAMSNNAAKPYASTDSSPVASFREYSAVNSDFSVLSLGRLVPQNAQKSFWNDLWNTSAYGVGRYYAGTNGNGGTLRRGGDLDDGINAGLFAVSLFSSATSGNWDRGFRCVFRPPS